MAGVAGRSGARQKPAALRALHGSRKRPRHHAQPVPVEGEPACPGYYTDVERALWEDYAHILRAQKRLTQDAATWLAAVVDAHREWLEWRTIAANSPAVQDKVTVDGSGQEHTEAKVHPARVQLRLSREALKSVLIEGGLTPASIGRVKMAEKPDEKVDPFAAFEVITGGKKTG